MGYIYSKGTLQNITERQLLMYPKKFVRILEWLKNDKKGRGEELSGVY